MGDYNVQIISASLKNITPEIEEEIVNTINKYSRNSAYHTTVNSVNIDKTYGDFRITAIFQLKYNQGYIDILDLIRPHVIHGMGPGNAWSINFSEYDKEPEIEYLNEVSDEAF